MKAKKFWHLKWLQEDGELRLFIVDGKECWRETQPVTTFSVTESKEERCYKKLKKWLKKVNRNGKER